MVIAVYMVAGLSSRFGGKIKQFAKVGKDGETLIEVSLKQAITSGAEKIVFIVGEKTEGPFRGKFGNSYLGVPVEYAKQSFSEEERDRPWGTTDALLSAKHLLDGPFVVCNGDDIYGKEAFELVFKALNSGLSATLGYELGKVIPSGGKTNRGIFESEEGMVKGLREVFEIEGGKLEEKGLSEKSLCSMNIFGLLPSALPLLEKRLFEFKKLNAGDRRIECLLPAELGTLVGEGKISMRLLPTKAKWLGVTNPGDEEFVRKELCGLNGN